MPIRTPRGIWGAQLSVKWWLTVVLPHKSASHVSPALGEGASVAWRNGSCVASEDCKFDKSISALPYGIGFGFWVNTTCCQGNCQEPTLLVCCHQKAVRWVAKEVVGGLEESLSWGRGRRQAGGNII